MGKGDQRTKRGKRIRGSYGKTRPKKPGKTPVSQIKRHIEHDESMTNAEAK